jgi:hypothetical protein
VDADEIYGLPLERFVPERDALAKSLRADGQREEAARVAKLRKPSVAAWAVNQLVRTQPRAVGELLEAGDALAQAHADIVGGSGDGGALRSAAERERAAVDALVAAARGLLTADGHELSPTIIDRVADTLHAAALEEHAREQVRHGRLERELRHVGLGAGGLTVAVPAPAPAAKRAARGTNPAAGGTKPAAPATEPEPKPDLTAERKAARATEAEARRRADRADRALRVATEHRDRAAERLREAEEALAEAEAVAREAAEAHRQAREALDQFGRA